MLQRRRWELIPSFSTPRSFSDSLVPAQTTGRSKCFPRQKLELFWRQAMKETDDRPLRFREVEYERKSLFYTNSRSPKNSRHSKIGRAVR